MADRHVRAMVEALSVDGGCIYCVESAITALVITLPHHDWVTSLRRAFPQVEQHSYSVEEYLAVLDKVTSVELAVKS